MKITLEMAQVAHDPKPVNIKGGGIQQFAVVAWMGGSARIANPKKLNGTFTSLEISCVLKQDAQQWKAGDGRSGAMSITSLQFVEILDGKAVK